MAKVNPDGVVLDVRYPAYGLASHFIGIHAETRDDLFNHDVRFFYHSSVHSSVIEGNEINIAILIPPGFDEDFYPNIRKFEVGELDGGYERTVLVAEFPDSFPVRAGLTIHNLKGSWSSYPAHKFESESLLSPAKLPEFDEIFVYLTSPAEGWGVQTISTTGKAYPFRDGETRHIPLSAHPVVAGPGYGLAYAWCYWGRNIRAMEKFGEHGRI